MLSDVLHRLRSTCLSCYDSMNAEKSSQLGKHDFRSLIEYLITKRKLTSLYERSWLKYPSIHCFEFTHSAHYVTSREYNYHPQQQFYRRVIFSHVSVRHSVHRRGVFHIMWPIPWCKWWCTPPYQRKVTKNVRLASGRHASYWNAFLFYADKARSKNVCSL